MGMQNTLITMECRSNCSLHALHKSMICLGLRLCPQDNLQEHLFEGALFEGSESLLHGK
jgi:hypothetical protein